MDIWERAFWAEGREGGTLREGHCSCAAPAQAPAGLGPQAPRLLVKD